MAIQKEKKSNTFSLKDGKTPDIRQKKAVAKIMSYSDLSNKPYLQPKREDKIKFKRIWGKTLTLDTVKEETNKYIHVDYNAYDKKKEKTTCKNACHLCENGKPCPKFKTEDVPFYLYQKKGTVFLMYFSQRIWNYYEILFEIYDFLYRHGEGIISTHKIYDFERKRLVDTKFHTMNKLIENSCQNRGLLKTCHDEMTLVSNEPYRLFVDTEGSSAKPTEVAFWVYDIGKKKVITKKDSKESTVHDVIQELNKWVKKDCIIYTHHTDHDVRILVENGFHYGPYTKFCCTSSNTNYRDLDILCEYFGIVVDQNKRHTAVYDAELILDCFKKDEKCKLFKLITYYKI